MPGILHCRNSCGKFILICRQRLIGRRPARARTPIFEYCGNSFHNAIRHTLIFGHIVHIQWLCDYSGVTHDFGHGMTGGPPHCRAHSLLKQRRYIFAKCPISGHLAGCTGDGPRFQRRL